MDHDKLLGLQAMDKITGFKGTITGVAYYLDSNPSACLAPKITDPNKAPDNAWFALSRLEIIAAA